MERDENGTYARLKAHRVELFEPKIKKHHGRVFKLMGDGLMAPRLRESIGLPSEAAEIAGAGRRARDTLDSPTGQHIAGPVIGSGYKIKSALIGR